MQEAAMRRGERHNAKVKETGLAVGQRVYIRDCNIRGRNKIQDHWNPRTHKVLRAPEGNGAVYSVAPIDNLDQVRQVHRTMLRLAHTNPNDGSSPRQEPATGTRPGDPGEEENEAELWVYGTTRGPFSATDNAGPGIPTVGQGEGPTPSPVPPPLGVVEDSPPAEDPAAGDQDSGTAVSPGPPLRGAREGPEIGPQAEPPPTELTSSPVLQLSPLPPSKDPQ